MRISCKNVTHGLSSVVFMSHPNQLPICHTSRFVKSQVLQKCFRESLQECHCCKNVCQVWQKCFTESVAEMSLWQECHTSRFVGCQVANLSRCRNVTLGSESDLTHPPMEKLTLRWKSSPPRWKSSPLSGNRDFTPPMEKLNPPMENDLTHRWKMTRVIRITKGEDNVTQDEHGSLRTVWSHRGRG